MSAKKEKRTAAAPKDGIVPSAGAGKSAFAAAAVASTAEILAFYTSVMRGEEEDASVTNRITAADKLLQQNESADASTASMERLDLLIDELRRAIDDGSFVAEDENAQDAAEEEIEEALPDEDAEDEMEEDEDEDQ